MADHIKIRKADGTWSVRAGGAILAESKNALELAEGDLPVRIYIPRDDIAMEFLDKTETTSHCPYKGDATYYSIVTKSTTLKDAAWSYESPKEDMQQIAGHLCFYASDTVKVAQI